MHQVQGNGLSPRNSAGRGHRRTRSATNSEAFGGAGSKQSMTPTPSAQRGRFFNDPAPSKPSSLAASTLPPLDSPSASSSSPTSTHKGHPQRQMKQSTFRLVAMVATALAVLLCTRATVATPTSRTHLRAGAATGAAAKQSSKDRCATRIEQRRGLGIPGDREQCAAVLPASVVEGESSWLVSVHVGRAPSAVQPAQRLRGAAQSERCVQNDREHYFVCFFVSFE